MFVHAVPVNLASRLLALPSWQAARQLSGEDLKLLIAAKETGAEGPTLLGFAGSNVSCQAVNSLVAETWYSGFFWVRVASVCWQQDRVFLQYPGSAACAVTAVPRQWGKGGPKTVEGYLP